MTAPPALTDAAIKEMEALTARASPGPWFTTGAPWFRSGDGVLAGSPDGNIGFLVADCDDFASPRGEYEGPFKVGDADDDAAFIAACREFVPAIIARQRADAERAVKAERQTEVMSIRCGARGRRRARRLAFQDASKAVEALNREIGKHRCDISIERAKVAQLEAQVARLRETLEPFAVADADDFRIDDQTRDHDGLGMVFRVGDLRRAAAVLAETEGAK